MVPERSIKIPEVGSAASAHHSVMELPNGTFGNKSSCQNFFVRLHDESMLFLRDSYLRYGGAAREGEGRGESGKWKGEGEAGRGRGEGEGRKGGSRKGEWEGEGRKEDRGGGKGKGGKRKGGGESGGSHINQCSTSTV